MSDDKDAFGFGKYVPGFDFLQNLSRGDAQGMPRMPSLSSWVAPTINVEELDKRIEELKAVQFWLDQNSTALKATVQALEVQKMTLATLKGMNFSMADMAEAFKLRPEMFGGPPSGDAPAQTATPARAAGAYDDLLKPSAAPKETAQTQEAPKPRPQAKPKAAPAAPAAGVVDPMQWWGALTEQFQQIAGNAMQEAASKGAAAGLAAGMPAAAGVFGNAFKPAAAATPRKAPAKKPAPKKSTAKKAATRKPAARKP